MNWFLFVTLLIYEILYCLVRAFYPLSCLTQIFHLEMYRTTDKTQFFYNFFPGIPNDSNSRLFNFLKNPREKGGHNSKIQVYRYGSKSK